MQQQHSHPAPAMQYNRCMLIITFVALCGLVRLLLLSPLPEYSSSATNGVDKAATIQKLQSSLSHASSALATCTQNTIKSQNFQQKHFEQLATLQRELVDTQRELLLQRQRAPQQQRQISYTPASISSVELASTIPDLAMIHSSGSNHFDLSDMLIGKSDFRDYNNNFYYYLVFKPEVDRFVSAAMLEKGGKWEPFLNNLLHHLIVVDEKVKARNYWSRSNETDSKNSLLVRRQQYVVVDTGANLGALTLYAAALGCRVLAFEMQQLVYTMLALSVRMSGYSSHVKVYNTPLWDDRRPISFDPVQGNLGGTKVREDIGGKITMTTERLDFFLQQQNIDDIFLLKLDVEGVEEHVVGGMGGMLDAGRVRHITIGDSHDHHLPLYRTLYQRGYSCRNYGPPDDSNFDRVGCLELDPQRTSSHCFFPAYQDLVSLFKQIPKERVRFNILCSLPAQK